MIKRIIFYGTIYFGAVSQSDERGKCSYMDLSGNCYILTKRFLLYVSGQDNKFIIHREKKNYLSKSSSAASAIIRTMLNEPERKWQVKTLAQESNTALGTVSNVKSFCLPETG